jgi:hypothetical protein
MELENAAEPDASRQSQKKPFGVAPGRLFLFVQSAPTFDGWSPLGRHGARMTAKGRKKKKSKREGVGSSTGLAQAHFEFALQCNNQNFSSVRNGDAIKAYLVSQRNVGFILSEVQMKKVLISAALFSALAFTPASAKMISCTGENMAKTGMMMGTMQDGPGKMGMNREMGMANMDMSNGKMRSACMHYMKAQKAAMMK